MERNARGQKHCNKMKNIFGGSGEQTRLRKEPFSLRIWQQKVPKLKSKEKKMESERIEYLKSVGWL